MVSDHREQTCLEGGDEWSDEELSTLFAEFDTVTASDDLKQRTLAAILSQAPAAEKENHSDAQVDDRCGQEGPDTDKSAAKDESIISFSEAKRARRGKRSFRFAKIFVAAACIAALSVGTVAYAMPSAQVAIGDGESTIVLNVNRFGVVLSADSDDEVGREILAQGGFAFVGYDQSLGRVLDAYAAVYADSGRVSIAVESGDEGQRDDLDARGEEALLQRGYEPEGDDGQSWMKHDEALSDHYEMNPNGSSTPSGEGGAGVGQNGMSANPDSGSVASGAQGWDSAENPQGEQSSDVFGGSGAGEGAAASQESTAESQ